LKHSRGNIRFGNRATKAWRYQGVSLVDDPVDKRTPIASGLGNR
jgi:hypothetical protein